MAATPTGTKNRKVQNPLTFLVGWLFAPCSQSFYPSIYIPRSSIDSVSSSSVSPTSKTIAKPPPMLRLLFGWLADAHKLCSSHRRVSLLGMHMQRGIDFLTVLIAVRHLGGGSAFAIAFSMLQCPQYVPETLLASPSYGESESVVGLVAS